MKLSRYTWPQIEEYLKSKQTVLLPIGSVEQHGPTGLVGTDFLTATTIAQRVGIKEEIMVAPPLCYGMSAHHMGFCGTITLSPQTLIHVVCDVVQSLSQHGFKEFYFINGHGGNIATISAAFCELKQKENDLKLHLISWFLLDEVLKYQDLHFKDENGHHATPGEVSVTMHTYPEAFERQTLPRELPLAKKERTHWPLSPQEFRKTYPDGRMGSNPLLATADHGRALIEIASDAISGQIHASR